MEWGRYSIFRTEQNRRKEIGITVFDINTMPTYIKCIDTTASITFHDARQNSTQQHYTIIELYELNTRVFAKQRT